MNIAIYGRVSTRDKGQDVENQFQQLRSFASKNDWVIVHEYVDKVSGSGKSKRLEFQAMFEDARMRKFDLVLFWALDRFTREGALPTLKYLETLTSYGVKWRSYTEQYIDSTGIFSDAIIGIMATLAKQERIRLSERVVAGLEVARGNGKEIGRPKKVFRRDLAREMRLKGKSIREIAKALGVPPMTIQTTLKALGVPKPSIAPSPLSGRSEAA